MSLARLVFYPSLGYNYIMSKVSSRHWYDRIDETVVLGALPLRSVTKTLISKENVRGMITLNEAYEMKHLTYSTEELSALGVEHLQLPTVDLTGTPTQENLTLAVKFIEGHRRHGNSVYVHCKAGRTRSATVALCYVMKVHGLSPKAAHKMVQDKRPHIWLREKQWSSIHQFYTQHCSDS